MEREIPTQKTSNNVTVDGKIVQPIRKRTYKDDDPLAKNFKITCRHSEHSKFQCSQFSKRDVIKNRQQLYKTCNKTSQEIYLTQLITTHDPFRRRPSKYPTRALRPKNLSSQFYLLRYGEPQLVCKNIFMNALSLTRKRIDFILWHIMNGLTPTERRGGKRKRTKKNGMKKSITVKDEMDEVDGACISLVDDEVGNDGSC